MAENKRELTFGEKAVGIEFNPGNSTQVYQIKEAYANIINGLNDDRTKSDDPEVKRMLSLAITASQEAQMWAVKAVTWNS